MCFSHNSVSQSQLGVSLRASKIIRLYNTSVRLSYLECDGKRKFAVRDVSLNCTIALYFVSSCKLAFRVDQRFLPYRPKQTKQTKLVLLCVLGIYSFVNLHAHRVVLLPIPLVEINNSTYSIVQISRDVSEDFCYFSIIPVLFQWKSSLWARTLGVLRCCVTFIRIIWKRNFIRISLISWCFEQIQNPLVYM